MLISKANFSNNNFYYLVYATILEKVLDQHVRDGVDDEPHVVGVGDASQMTVGLRPGLFLLLELLGQKLNARVILLRSGVVRKSIGDRGALHLILSKMEAKS